MNTTEYTLYSVAGSGAALTELLLARAKLPYRVHTMSWEQMRTDPAYAEINPLRQVPALRLPSGALMTESLAIGLHLNEVAQLNLVPTEPERRAQFLRWAVYLVASIYPTFTFGDDPSNWVSFPAAREELRKSSDAFREKCWRAMESAAGDGPYFLGPTESLIDVHLSCMTLWRPGEAWFATHCPKLHTLALGARGTEIFKKVYARHAP